MPGLRQTTTPACNICFFINFGPDGALISGALCFSETLGKCSGKCLACEALGNKLCQGIVCPGMSLRRTNFEFYLRHGRILLQLQESSLAYNQVEGAKCTGSAWDPTLMPPKLSIPLHYQPAGGGGVRNKLLAKLFLQIESGTWQAGKWLNARRC